jgi:hypothetical protein
MLQHLMDRFVVTARRARADRDRQPSNHRSRRRLLFGASLGVLLTAVVIGSMPTAAVACPDDNQVEGGWYITVDLEDPSPATFDALYGFARGGVFTRIDGRTNAPALGTWKRNGDGEIIFSAILFNFTAGEVPTPATRNGAILGKFSARVTNGMLTGTFSADGILGLTNFHRAGKFTGTRIAPEAP